MGVTYQTKNRLRRTVMTAPLPEIATENQAESTPAPVAKPAKFGRLLLLAAMVAAGAFLLLHR